jgi:hypothetical protein
MFRFRFKRVKRLVTLKSMTSTIKRTRKRHQPPTTNCAIRYSELLSQYPQYGLSLGGDTFYSGTVGGPESTSVIFVNKEIIDDVSTGKRCKVHMDGTFKTVPPMFTQLFVILVAKKEHVSLIYLDAHSMFYNLNFFNMHII